MLLEEQAAMHFFSVLTTIAGWQRGKPGAGGVDPFLYRYALSSFCQNLLDPMFYSSPFATTTC